MSSAKMNLMHPHTRRELFFKLFSTANPPNEKNNSIDGVFLFSEQKYNQNHIFYDMNEYLS